MLNVNCQMLRSLLSIWLFLSLGATAPAMAVPKKTVTPLSSLEVAIIPENKNKSLPLVEAQAALVMDVESGLILYQKNPNSPRPMASLTKIMTAILILENHRSGEVVTVQDDFTQYPELGVRLWLHQYEKITIDDLLIGLLVPSAGDAALALAQYHSGSSEKFVDEMNAKAATLGLKNTHFLNPIGLDEQGHFSSAFDLAILTRYALKFPEFRRIILLTEATVTSTDGKIKHEFKSTDELLGSYLNIRGVKTGTTDEAGQSVINLARNPRGHEILSVVLGSSNRFQESKQLIDWSFRNFLW